MSLVYLVLVWCIQWSDATYDTTDSMSKLPTGVKETDGGGVDVLSLVPFGGVYIDTRMKKHQTVPSPMVSDHQIMGIAHVYQFLLIVISLYVCVCVSPFQFLL